MIWPGMRAAIILFTVASIGWSDEVLTTQRSLPLIEDGGGRYTEITLVNLESSTASFQMLFQTDSGGRYWALQPRLTGGPSSAVAWDGSYVTGVLQPGQSVTFRTPGDGAELRMGHATLYSVENARFGMQAVIFNGSKQLLVVPACPEREDHLLLPFDNTNGRSASILWISETPYALVHYRVRTQVADGNADGLIATGDIQFTISDDRTLNVFRVDERFPETSGLRGTVELTIDYPSAGIYDELYFTALVIQTPGEPDGKATVLRSMASGAWRAQRH